MNDADVGKQVQQMVRFILQEADEKASEITVAAEEVSTLPNIDFKSRAHKLSDYSQRRFSDSFFPLPFFSTHFSPSFWLLRPDEH